jgi:lysophospholipase L1-like esterase
VELPEPSQDGLLEIPANHPDIFYMGRIDCSDPLAPSFAYPGASIRVRFSGNRLDLKLKDFGDSTPTGTNYYGVRVDQTPTFALAVSGNQQSYTLAQDLPPGEHEVEIFKRTESNHGSGKANLLGFRLSAGGRMLPVHSKPRRLEFIGDSITCGYGNELSTDNPENAHYTTKNSNAQQAYGAISARELNAEYLAVAASGRGISRNYAGEPGTLVPELHKLALPDEQVSWDFARYQPDVAVINLGTNDYSTPGVDRTVFRKRYEQFLVDLRGRYPNTMLVVAIGPMLSDDYPPGEQVLTKIRQDINAVLKTRQQAGDKKLELIEFEPQSPPFGEDWHPTRATHEKMATKLVARLKKLMGW